MKLDSLINKANHLNKSYIPEDLFTIDQNENNFHKYKDVNLKPAVSIEILPYFLAMQYFAHKEGYHIIIDSGYRSYQYQQIIWDKFKEEVGEEALSLVAPPGASEHQTGLAFDIAYLKGVNLTYDDKVEETDAEVAWLRENAHLFGFILRYPLGKEHITGYKHEPWHYRFIGVPLATCLKKNGITLEEYYLDIERYKKDLSNEIPFFITELAMMAAIYYVRNSFQELNVEELLDKYQRLFPGAQIIPIVPIHKESLLKGLQALPKENLEKLAGYELIAFVENYLYLGR